MPNLTPMTADQAQHHVDQIKAGINDIGRHLLELHDGRGWEALGYETWRACAQAEFGFGKSQAYRLMAEAKVIANLQNSPIGENVELPSRESHIRELAKLPSDQQAEAWETAQQEAEANDEPLTAKTVAAVVSRRLEDRPDSIVDDPSPNRAETQQPAPVDSGHESDDLPAAEERTVIDFWKPVREQIFTFAKSLSDADRGVLGAFMNDATECVQRNEI